MKMPTLTSKKKDNADESFDPRVPQMPKLARPPKHKKRDKNLIAYRYNALDEMGKKVAGVEMALSLGAAHLALIQQGLQPLDINPKRNILRLEITKKMVPRSDVMNFTRQLAVFMRAGVPLWKRSKSS